MGDLITEPQVIEAPVPIPAKEVEEDTNPPAKDKEST